MVEDDWVDLMVLPIRELLSFLNVGAKALSQNLYILHLEVKVSAFVQLASGSSVRLLVVEHLPIRLLQFVVFFG